MPYCTPNSYDHKVAAKVLLFYEMCKLYSILHSHRTPTAPNRMSPLGCRCQYRGRGRPRPRYPQVRSGVLSRPQSVWHKPSCYAWETMFVGTTLVETTRLASSLSSRTPYCLASSKKTPYPLASSKGILTINHYLLLLLTRVYLELRV